jgi:two-component system, cell cycle sensor histidine kinase and response regulator CckA
VESTLKMLRRLIGEDVDLAWLPENGLWPVKMDPSQVGQILANLCVNARDAINGVGRITIETHRKSFEEAYCIDHPGFVPGDYVQLTVNDDGCGMDPDTQRNIFEPFFTTKAVGEGTGLGLATVYGIVKQNNGFITVYSEPGEGTSFHIYLSRHSDPVDEIVVENEEEIPRGNGETVLVVEDDVSILHLAQKILAELGYQVLTAASPSEALRFARDRQLAIDLLIADVVMPEMNGKELADLLCGERAGLKTLFMSGYTADVIANHGVLEKGVNFIQKPFSIRDLAVKAAKSLRR